MNFKNKLKPIRHKTIALAIILALLLPTLSLTMVTSEDQTYQNITVDIAHYMIENEEKYPNLVIMDVRTQCEYEKGHLYDAILIPHDKLEIRIDELEEYKNTEIIVYCKSGYRSQLASEILVEYGFTKVYNMLGGIIAWVGMNYPIYTTYHHITVDKLKEKILFQIEPLIKSTYICCTKHQPNPDDIEVPSITFTVLEEEENYIEVLFTVEIDDSIIEGTIAKTLLFNYKEITNKKNRTLDFIFTEITIEESSIEFYTLNYIVHHVNYNMTLYTVLTPLNSENYNISSTIMSYDTADKSGMLSMEFVEFNFSTKLSTQYAILGKIAKKIGNVYKESNDKKLKQLAKAYNTMAKEAKHLSEFVKEQLKEYDKPITIIMATLRDGLFGCIICEIGCTLAVFAGCGIACFFYPYFCYYCIEVMDMLILAGSCAIACDWIGCWDWLI